MDEGRHEVHVVSRDAFQSVFREKYNCGNRRSESVRATTNEECETGGE